MSFILTANEVVGRKYFQACLFVRKGILWTGPRLCGQKLHHHEAWVVSKWAVD